MISSCAHIPTHGVNRVREVEIPIQDLPERLVGYRIAFVSDIHYGNNFSGKRFDRLISSVNEAGADCIILGGDYTRTRGDIPDFARLAGRFSAKEGVYAVMGNHDFYNGMALTVSSLRDEGIVVLDETAVETPRGLVIAGINDLRDIYPVTKRLGDILDRGEVTVLASHNPDFAEEADLDSFDLVLSGHTHGGQITFFGYAPVIPSLYGQKYRTGTVISQGVPVVVSNGAGYSGDVLRFRLFAPSDYLLVRLIAATPR